MVDSWIGIIVYGIPSHNCTKFVFFKMAKRISFFWVMVVVVYTKGVSKFMAYGRGILGIG